MPSASTSQQPSPRTKVTSWRGRRSGRSGGRRAWTRHAITAVSPIVARTPWRAARDRRAQLRHDPALEDAGVEQPVGLDGGDRVDDRAVEQTPGTSVTKTIRSAPSPTASAAAASSAFTFSGPRASGATTGTSPAASAARCTARGTAAGRRRGRAPGPVLREPDLVAEQADGAAGRSPRTARRSRARATRARPRAPPRSSRGGRRRTRPAGRAAPSPRRSAGRRRGRRRPRRPPREARAIAGRRSPGRAADLDDDAAHVAVVRVDADVVVGQVARQVAGARRRRARGRARSCTRPRDVRLDVGRRAAREDRRAVDVRASPGRGRAARSRR